MSNIFKFFFEGTNTKTILEKSHSSYNLFVRIPRTNKGYDIVNWNIIKYNSNSKTKINVTL